MKLNLFLSKNTNISLQESCRDSDIFKTYLRSQFSSGIESYFDKINCDVNSSLQEEIQQYLLTNNFLLLEREKYKKESIPPFFLNQKKENTQDIFEFSTIIESYSFDAEDLFLEITYAFVSQEFRISLAYHSSRAAVAQKLIEFFSKFRKIKKQKQSIFNLLSEKDGLNFASVGEIYHSFSADNYTVEISSTFDFLCAELSKEQLQNKFTLLSGPPGTGKTHFVRALISSLSNTAIINLDQSVASNFSSSQILSALLKFKQENDFQSILFLIEDADYLILTRSLDNMGPLSSLLNASDGILGDIFNLRILATTNAKKIEIEKALLRPGRLLKHVEFGLLSTTQANQIFARLASEKNLVAPENIFTASKSLAEIYQAIYELELQGNQKC